MGTLTTQDSCLHEVLWIWCHGLRLLRQRQSYVFNAWAHFGAALLLLDMVLTGAALSYLLCSHCHGPGPGLGWLLLPGIAVALGLSGTTAVCFGTHRKRAGGDFRVTGAEVHVHRASPNAPLGILVIVGGYGSESPAFCEPAFVCNPELASDDLRTVLNRFRWRVVLRLHGGLGWDGAETMVVAESLDRLLREAPLASAAALPCVVIAHSRGTQIVAVTGVFRSPNWQRFAVHPPAGVNPLLRLFSRLSPEIAEIHRYGAMMAGRETASEGPPGMEPAQANPADFPWTVLYQASGWDHTVVRFSPEPGRPLRNLSPWGTHTLPFAAGSSRVWGDLGSRLAALAPAGR